MTSGHAYLLLFAFAAAMVFFLAAPLIDEIGASIERSALTIQDLRR